MQASLLGGLAPRDFLRRHWQKRPLLVRGAWPGFAGVADRRLLERLAARDDVESRLVKRGPRGWSVTHGPLPRARVARAGPRDWTLLVSGVNLHVARADALLRRFRFVPQARLDDVMVSYAAPGGGVGPHFDSYDVFLLQGEGRRVWRLCRPRRFALVPHAPLRLIDDFVAEEEYLVEPGDLLYLPPGWGHDGVALEACTTCSIGFRAPGGTELASAFLDWLHARGLPEARYRDRTAVPAAHAAEIPSQMIDYARGVIARLRWTRRDVLDFFGEQLSAPKPHVVFRRPARPLSASGFVRRLARCDVTLDARTQLLYRGARFYVNGERLVPRATQRAALAALADARRASGRSLLHRGLCDLAYEWYRSGFLTLQRAATTA